MANNKPFCPVQATSSECDGSFEKMLRRFVRRSRDEGTLDEIKARIGFVKPCQQRRAAKKSARL